MQYFNIKNILVIAKLNSSWAYNLLGMHVFSFNCPNRFNPHLLVASFMCLGSSSKLSSHIVVTSTPCSIFPFAIDPSLSFCMLPEILGTRHLSENVAKPVLSYC